MNEGILIGGNDAGQIFLSPRYANRHKGIPTPVQRALIRPPHSRMGNATVAEREVITDADHNKRSYGKTFDPRSAHKVLMERIAANQKRLEQAELKKSTKKADDSRK